MLKTTEKSFWQQKREAQTAVFWGKIIKELRITSMYLNKSAFASTDLVADQYID